MHRLPVRPLLTVLRVARSPPACAVSSARFASSVAGREPPSNVQRQPPKYTSAKPRISAKLALDPAATYTPSEYVDLQLKSPQIQEVVKNLSPNDAEAYEILSSRLTSSNGHSDVLAINDIGEFFERRGVDIDLPNSLFEPPESHSLMNLGSKPELMEMSYTDKDTKQVKTFRSIVDPIPALDSRDEIIVPRTRGNPFGGRVITRNRFSIFDTPSDSSSPSSSSSTPLPDAEEPTPFSELPPKIMGSLYQATLIRRRVVHQSSKGKIYSNFCLVLIGNGNGLVGYGQGKNTNPRLALQKAQIDALKNLDYVDRFEGRTVWTEMEGKLGATRLFLRPRPVGFGLRCNPHLHQILRAAGFKDISAKVWGSANRMMVIKLAFMMLQGGHAPTAMGDGLGGKGRKLARGVGMQGKTELERARGRKLISLRK